MRKLNNKTGFTLIEIIVVLIIVGILAAIALPNLFGNIQKSRSTQALQEIDWMKTAFETCLASNSTITPPAGACTMVALNLPTAAVNGWTYSLPAAGVAQGATAGGSSTPTGTYLGTNLVYSLQATDGTNTLVVNRAAAGTWTCSVGTASPYTGVC